MTTWNQFVFSNTRNKWNVQNHKHKPNLSDNILIAKIPSASPGRTNASWRRIQFIWFGCITGIWYKIKCVSLIYGIFYCPRPRRNTRSRVVCPTLDRRRQKEIFGLSSLLIFRSTEHQNGVLKGCWTKFDIRSKALQKSAGEAFSENIRKVILKLLRIYASL